MESDHHYRTEADGKPAKRRSRTGAGGSKKASSRSSTSSRVTAGAVTSSGGDRVEPRGNLRNGSLGSGGSTALADSAFGSRAQGKDSSFEAGRNKSRERGAKGAGRHSGERSHAADVARRGNEGSWKGMKQGQALADAGVSDAGAVLAAQSADRAILERWRTKSSSNVLGDGHSPTSSAIPSAAQDTPEEIRDEENGYDDEGFEDYSDEFDGAEGGDDDGTPASASFSSRATGGIASSALGRSLGSSPVVSPALKMRPANATVQAPDDKTLQELRHSLREENDVARERRIAKPVLAADSESVSQSSRGSKSSKSSKSSRNAAAGATGASAYEAGDRISKGNFSVEAVADSKGPSRTRSSSFKMADAKLLTRALAKGDPRMERVQAIRATSRLETQSIRLFDQPPVAPIDLYLRRLRGPSPPIRQTGTQVNEDSRSVETQTEEIAYADKEVQFHLGHDDTALENLMRRIRSARRSSASDPQHRGGSGKRPEDEHKQEQGPGITSTAERVHRTDLDTLSSSTTFKDVYRSPDPPRSKGRGRPPPPPPLRLGKFLRQACLVMETLCEENILSARVAIQRQDGCASRTARMLLLADPTEDDGKDGRYTLFPSKEGRAAGPHHDGGECGWEELAVLSVIAGAEVVGVAFSKAKRSMLVTAHSKLIKVACASGGDATGGGHSHGNRSNSDGCGLVCVWNVESATVAPTSALLGEGLFSCLCLPPHQPHILLVGTGEGCLLLWDLREPVASSHAQESQELGLTCGLRPPTYTTAGGGSGERDTMGFDPGYGHASAIVSVVPIPVSEGGSGDSGVGDVLSLGESTSFQVASLDDRGTVSIWLVTETPTGEEGGSQTDLGLSPGGRVRLTLSKSLRSGEVAVREDASSIGDGLSTLSRFSSSAARVATSRIRGGIVKTSAAAAPGTAVGSNRSGAATGARDTAFEKAAAVAATAAAARVLAFSSEDPNRFVVGTSSDTIVHASRLGDLPLPRVYRGPFRPRLEQGCRQGGDTHPNNAATKRDGTGLSTLGGVLGLGCEDGKNTSCGGVTCLSFSSFFRHCFLAGYGDGSVRLYKDNCATPCMVWENFSRTCDSGGWPGEGVSQRISSPVGIASIAWSDHRPAVFLALDSAGTLHAFDLLENDSCPTVSEPCPVSAGIASTPAGRASSGTSRRKEDEKTQEGLPDPDENGMLRSGERSRERDPEEKAGGHQDGAADRGFVPTRPRPVLWAPPGMALSSETLATGSRPRVAISIGGRTFMRGLSARVFRSPIEQGDPHSDEGAGRDVGSRSNSSGGGGGAGGSGKKRAGERERMKDWLDSVF